MRYRVRQCRRAVVRRHDGAPPRHAHGPQYSNAPLSKRGRCATAQRGASRRAAGTHRSTGTRGAAGASNRGVTFPAYGLIARACRQRGNRNGHGQIAECVGMHAGVFVDSLIPPSPSTQTTCRSPPAETHRLRASSIPGVPAFGTKREDSVERRRYRRTTDEDLELCTCLRVTLGLDCGARRRTS
jgi:hypothetical protein